MVMKVLLVFCLAVFTQSSFAGSKPATWRETIQEVVPAIVAIRVVGTRDFDTESARSSGGTGFVVDKERGIILTNRHMVHAGPVVAEAVFSNHEEVALSAIYRDPVHDFGFYKFDPSAVRFLELEELKLNSESASVGTEIRVIGNDSGEKISILDGTLARLDRAAPNYGGNSYNDFNTFYLQAASNTSGGSSGSPVINKAGEVIGLNAGGSTRTASSFYLPLARVERALRLLQAEQAVTRGTIQSVFRYKPFDELRRLGLPESLEADFRERFPDSVGALVVDETVPEGPGDKRLEPGDILLSANGKILNDFETLEAFLDDNIGKEAALGVRRGGETLTLQVPVQDLHSITPREFLEFSRGVFHTVSYQQARNHMVPAKGVYVALGGYAFGNAGIRKGAVITMVGDTPVPTLDEFQQALEALPDKTRVPVQYHWISEPLHGLGAVLSVDRGWYGMRRCRRDDSTGVWPCVDAQVPPSAVPGKPATARPAIGLKGLHKRVNKSLVLVDFNIPFPTVGVSDFNYQGTGVVVDKTEGLVLVDRDTAPANLGDASITFGGQVRIPAQIIYLDRVHNFSVLKYDPALLGGTEVEELEISDRMLKPEETVWQVGLNSSHQPVMKRTQVEVVKPLYMASSSTPKFRDANVEGVDIEDWATSIGGALVDRKGRMLSLWASFHDPKEDDREFFGLPTIFFKQVIDDLKKGNTPIKRDLGAELWPISLADARELGLPESYAQQLYAKDPKRGKVLSVIRRWGAAPARAQLKDGDLILGMNGKLVTRVVDFAALNNQPAVTLTVFRLGKVMDVEVSTVAIGGGGIDDLISWAGLIVHTPHHEVEAQTGLQPDGVYIAWMWYGTSAARFGLRPTRRIVEIDGKPTPDMNSFYEVVRTHTQGQAVRVKMKSLDDKVTVRTLKLDQVYWPTERLELREGVWIRQSESSEKAK